MIFWYIPWGIERLPRNQHTTPFYVKHVGRMIILIVLDIK